jgi:hypothetical protein
MIWFLIGLGVVVVVAGIIFFKVYTIKVTINRRLYL